VLLAVFATVDIAQAQDFKQRFVGKSPCASDMQSEHSDFSLRLDKNQDLTDPSTSPAETAGFARDDNGGKSGLKSRPTQAKKFEWRRGPTLCEGQKRKG